MGFLYILTSRGGISMFEKFDMHDQVLHQKLFVADEVGYNFMYQICEMESSKRIKSCDEDIVFAQPNEQNAWLWISKELAEDKKIILLEELVELLQGNVLPGVTGDRRMVEQFAQLYSKAHATMQYTPHMSMYAHCCFELKKPMNINGEMRRATSGSVDIVAQFIAGFSEDAHGIKVDPKSQIATAEGMIEAGNLHLWFIDNQPVSMANIGYRSTRHARINAVYTSTGSRKQGYASALVAELCSLIKLECLEPMLYTDLGNFNSLNLFKNIGFVEMGKIMDFKFT